MRFGAAANLSEIPCASQAKMALVRFRPSSLRRKRSHRLPSVRRGIVTGSNATLPRIFALCATQIFAVRSWWLGGLVAWWLGGLVAWWLGGLVAWWLGGGNICRRANSEGALMTNTNTSRFDPLLERASDADISDLRWPSDPAEIPDWIYTDRRIYDLEQKRIFGGPTWNYVALEVELPNPGDFIRSYIGDVPIIVARDEQSVVHAFENRCAHRGAEFCKTYRGSTKQFICPYHQWTYDLSGALVSVPFRRGVKGVGGMPPRLQPWRPQPAQP